MLTTTAPLWLLSHKRFLYRLLSRRLRLSRRTALWLSTPTWLALGTAPLLWLSGCLSTLLSLLRGNLLR